MMNFQKDLLNGLKLNKFHFTFKTNTFNIVNKLHSTAFKQT